MIKRLSNAEYKYVYSKVPRLCLDILIVTSEGFVLTKRDIEPYKGLWHIPGGGMKYGETVSEAIDRISEKETGIIPQVCELLGYIDHPDEHKLGYGWPISFVFRVKIKKGKLKGSPEGKEIKTFKKTPINTLPTQKEFLNYYLKSKAENRLIP